ncbi:hypothetical protein E8E15_000320 [Penicillium rubens]|uniref:Uncharacterized protein n=1 Tax=Penicillium chrysogenum TaxID=5076 RepID=A0ABQ8WF20_PENCH|nr:hypothetical protein E8E15_000320 [Penicillium rubens]KAJ5265046.1 hypothetical protein N7505_007839 [Penicillium chrysogenum]
MVVGIANLTHHSLQLCGETELISPETAKHAGVDLCYQRLSWQPKNDGSTFKVVYIVGTGNNDKLINMELDIQKKLKHIRDELSVDIEFLGIFGLDVSSGQPGQPVGFVQGLSGAAGSTGRIGNCVSAIEKLWKGENLRLEIPQGLELAVRSANIHIFGGQEASGVEHGPTSAESKKHYDANFIAYYLGTKSAVEQSQCYSMAKSPGLEMIGEALFEATKRNGNEAEDMDWTHGKVLAEKRPDIVRDPKDWHQELSCDRLGRFAYSNMGYDKLELPTQWFKHATLGITTNAVLQ